MGRVKDLRPELLPRRQHAQGRGQEKGAITRRLTRRLAAIAPSFASAHQVVNAQGLTWSQWRRVACAPSFWDGDVARVRPYYAAWWAGEDPSAYASLAEVP